MNCRVAATFENIFKDLSVSRVCNLESAKAFFMEEIWKDIPLEIVKYQASSEGNIRSVDKHVKDGERVRLFKGRVLKQTKRPIGYSTVGLSINGVSKTYLVHQLVAMAFLGHNPSGMKLVIDHINGDKNDNSVNNLRIVTQKENINFYLINK